MNGTKHEKTINHFRIGGALLVLPFIVLWAGCTEKEKIGNIPQQKLVLEQVKQVRIGQTTKTQAKSLLGKPTSTVEFQGRTLMFYTIYRDLKEDGDQTAYAIASIATGPSIGPYLLFAKNKYTDNTISIVIGKNGYVEDIERIYSVGHFTGLLIKDDYPHADITKADQIVPGVTTQEQINILLGAPPSSITTSQARNNSNAIWFCESGQLAALGVISRQDSIVDEVKKYFKITGFKRVNADKVAQIKEQQSTRQTAESVFGSPSTISRNVQGSFYTYFIEVRENREEVYIQYDNNGVITRLIRKPLPAFH
ncbi:MAG: hypothetical protein ABSB25_01350 [Sedimentisphaerales bacterium]|jgi:outer membrane protein assembly factor BamE (lipoprotein component of BamABCDE complex)